MTSLVLHPRSKQAVARVKATLPHALILTGSSGVGLSTIAQDIADINLVAVIEPLGKDDRVDHAVGHIRISQIRDLYTYTGGVSTARRVVIIDDADLMQGPAQSAFLKLLEEPSKNTHFILTTHAPERLLPTIRSRCEQIEILPITTTQTINFIKSSPIDDPSLRQQIRFIADGKPAELSRLLSNQHYQNTRIATFRKARALLQSRGYETLCLLTDGMTSRSEALLLIEACIAIIMASLKSYSDPELIEKCVRYATVHEHIKANGNLKMQLLRLVV